MNVKIKKFYQDDLTIEVKVSEDSSLTISYALAFEVKEAMRKAEIYEGLISRLDCGKYDMERLCLEVELLNEITDKVDYRIIHNFEPFDTEAEETAKRENAFDVVISDYAEFFEKYKKEEAQ